MAREIDASPREGGSHEWRHQSPAAALAGNHVGVMSDYQIIAIKIQHGETLQFSWNAARTLDSSIVDSNNALNHGVVSRLVLPAHRRHTLARARSRVVFSWVYNPLRPTERLEVDPLIAQPAPTLLPLVTRAR